MVTIMEKEVKRRTDSLVVRKVGQSVVVDSLAGEKESGFLLESVSGLHQT